MPVKRICKKTVNLEKTTEYYRYLHEITTEDGMNLVMTRKVPIAPKKDQGPVASILLVHGLGQNRYSWTLSKRSLENYLVSHGFETFNVELRGHGLSRANGCEYPAHFETYLNYDMPAIIKEVYNLTDGKKFFYMGHSLGGSISYCIGSMFQEYIAGIISIAGPFNMAEGNLLIKSIAKVGTTLGKYFPFGSSFEPEVFYIDYIGVIAKYGLFMLDSHFYKLPLQVWYPEMTERDILVERIVKGFDRTSFNVIKFFFEWGDSGKFISSDGAIDFENRISDLNIPILFVNGDRDYAVPIPAVHEAFRKAGSKDKIFKIFGGESQGVYWGHIDLICGRYAPTFVWPYILKWLKKRIPDTTTT